MDGEKKITRRLFGKLLTATGAATLLPSESMAKGIESIADDKNAAIDLYLADLKKKQNIEALDHVSRPRFWGKKGDAPLSESEIRKELFEDSTMFSPDDSSALRGKFIHGTNRISEKLKEGQTGVYIGGEDQKLYLIRKTSGAIEFVRGYEIISAKGGWSNKENSGGSPFGLDTLKLFRFGLLGQVISTLKGPVDNNPDKFQPLTIHKGTDAEKRVPFVKGLTREVQPVPEVISSAILLDGERGIWIHAAPRKGFQRLPPDERRKVGSRGCFGMTDLDIRDLMRHVQQGAPIYIDPGQKKPDETPSKEKPDLGWIRFK